MASPNLDEIVSTTLRHRGPKLIDNVSKNNAVLSKLKSKGNVKSVSGGRSIVEPLEYQENGTFMWYSGYDSLNTTPQDVITAAEFDWKQCAGTVSMSGLEEIQNSGPEAVIDLLEARIKNLEHTMENQLCSGIYSDGTGYGGKQIGGLQLLIPDDPTAGSAGGISRVNYSFWRPKKFSGTSDGSGATSASNIQSYMHRLYLQVVRGRQDDYLLIADNNFYRYYLESLTNIQRITSDKSASSGFTSLAYMGSEVVFDGGYGGACPANHMYFVNTNYVKLRYHKDRNMVPLGKRESTNQDAMVKIVAWAGNMTISNGFTSGVLLA